MCYDTINVQVGGIDESLSDEGACGIKSDQLSDVVTQNVFSVTLAYATLLTFAVGT
jgi:hypothetical protein